MVRKTTYKILLFLFLAFIQTLPVSTEQEEDIPHQEVKNWALKFGFDLWSYGKQITRMGELQKRYHEEKIDVVRKDGLIRIREFAGEVKNMMDIKMSAVMRIMDSAEQAALTPQTDSGQPIKFYDARKINIFGPDGQPVEDSRGLILTPNTHFDHLPVNTSLSSVLIPTHIDVNNPELFQAIQWSEHLDPLFVNNYESDPSLSWQFFGSSVGFLRRYPAISWPPGDVYSSWQRSQNAKSVYDFRSSSWYVNAATSPKDIVILVDVSSSMSTNDLSLAKVTVEAILNTLSNNDFVNILKFSDSVEEIMPCFRNLLVQANNENLQNLKDALGSLSLGSRSNFTSALVAGFEILHKYNRTGQGCQCNQAIMLISSAPPTSYKEVFKIYNWPHRPVRVFTYLIGSSGTSSEMYWMACENKGYYTRISDYSEIKPKVLHYIEVMARPMVMYQNDHPIQWSPAYVGGKRNSLSNEKKQQLMTTVSIPVFDRRNHSFNEREVRVANLLGVVGTDVSVDQIKKLVPSFKLGVNGYSFVVNNNGHVLHHPDLRPLNYNENFDETLKPSYLSIDLNEVELIDGENGPRENHSALLDLRQDMIDQKEGETELNVKVHYDEMRRVTTRRHKYFYNPIEGTPFSLGIAIPEGYGMYELIAEQEIKHSQKNVTEYFKGDNWRVHPDWVYCEYTSGYSGEKFKTAEERVLHFLSRSRRPGWKWMSLRPRYHNHHSSKQEKDAYFCDKTLLQSLVLDAMVTEEIERSSADPKYSDPFATLWVLLLSQGHEKMFGLQLSFIATRSGLLRWKDYGNNSGTHFSEQNVHATDEIWYKRAVDQHAIEAESFVFSVPHNVGANSQTLVTATHAVFVEHKGHRAPVAVVGMQFLHSELANHFLVNITSICPGPPSCPKTCKSDALDCYILDNNGFIIISENPEHTGRFFGQIDGTIMDSLVQDRIYKKVQVYDYQGACPSSRINFSGHSSKLSPFFPMVQIVNWIFKALALLMPFLDNFYGAALSFSDYSEQDYDLDNYAGEVIPDSVTVPSYFPANPSFAIPPTETDPMEGIDISQFSVKRCDRKVDLYNLQPSRLNTSGMSNPLKGKLTNCHSSGCERPFSVQKIPHSNLILLVVDTLCPCGSKQLSIQPQEILYDSNECLHKPKDGLYRRRPPKCINYHPEEIEIKQCGEASEVGVSFTAIIIGLIHCLIAGLS